MLTDEPVSGHLRHFLGVEGPPATPPRPGRKRVSLFCDCLCVQQAASFCSKQASKQPPSIFLRKTAPSFLRLHLPFQDYTFLFKTTPPFPRQNTFLSKTIHLPIQDYTFLSKTTPSFSRPHLPFQDYTSLSKTIHLPFQDYTPSFSRLYTFLFKTIPSFSTIIQDYTPSFSRLYLPFQDYTPSFPRLHLPLQANGFLYKTTCFPEEKKPASPYQAPGPERKEKEKKKKEKGEKRE